MGTPANSVVSQPEPATSVPSTTTGVAATPGTEAPTTASSSTSLVRGNTLADDVDGAQAFEQLITVTSAPNVWKTNSATFRRFEKVGGRWEQVSQDVPSSIGYGGFNAGRHEGDHSSPAGIFDLPYLFGSQPDPTGPGQPDYRPVRAGACWGATANGPDYNRWYEAPTCRPGDEDLTELGRDAYRYAAVIGFNYDAPIPGLGSAIFLHVRTGPNTEGCVAIPESELVSTLQWLRPGARMAMGPEDFVRSL